MLFQIALKQQWDMAISEFVRPLSCPPAPSSLHPMYFRIEIIVAFLLTPTLQVGHVIVNSERFSAPAPASDPAASGRDARL